MDSHIVAIDRVPDKRRDDVDVDVDENSLLTGGKSAGPEENTRTLLPICQKYREKKNGRVFEAD